MTEKQSGVEMLLNSAHGILEANAYVLGQLNAGESVPDEDLKQLLKTHATALSSLVEAYLNLTDLVEDILDERPIKEL